MGPEQNWLYRQGDLILGPVPTKALVDKLYSGELTPTTEVQELGTGVFHRMQDVADLKVHVAKAAAKKRIDAQEAKHHTSQRRKMTVVMGVVLAVLVVLGAGVGVVGRYMAVHGPSAKSAEELALAEITIDAPSITRARRADDEELMEYKSESTGGPSQGAPTGKQPKEGKAPEGKAPKPKMGQADSEGMQMGEVDQGAINDVIARYKPKLIPCLKAVAKPGMPATKVPIEFSITETGKVGKVWVDNPDFKSGPLPECLLKELQSWPFKPSPGGGATVQLSFNIGKKG